MFPTRAGGRCSPLIAPSHYFAFKSEESDESEAISHAIPIPCGEMRKKVGGTAVVGLSSSPSKRVP